MAACVCALLGTRLDLHKMQRRNEDCYENI